jgi:hypothetical protein
LSAARSFILAAVNLEISITKGEEAETAEVFENGIYPTRGEAVTFRK